jgi:heterotetrameric sarcosine oxidase gamma subunit
MEADCVVDLIAVNPTCGPMPMKIGTVVVEEVHTSLFTVGVHKEISKSLLNTMKSVTGMDWPNVCQIKSKDNISLMWFDHTHVAIMGVTPTPQLEKIAAVTDVSDAWLIIDIDGVDARKVLSRVTPTDMREEHFKIGTTQRGDLMHMQASISCIAEHRFRIMVFRSMAQTLLHELTIAMKSVAARTREA